MSDDLLRDNVMGMLLKKKNLSSGGLEETSTLRSNEVTESLSRIERIQESDKKIVFEETKYGIDEDSVIEQLADYAHNAWSGWMEHLFKQVINNQDGSVTIPKDLVDKWMGQLGTSYGDLTEKEQDSDRVEAKKILAITGKRKPVSERKKPKDLSKALTQVVENQTKMEVDKLDSDVVELNIMKLLERDKITRKEIYEAIF